MGTVRRCGRAAFLAIVTPLLPCPGSGAAVINVPGDHATIQAAIAASLDGDEIVVAPGTYHEAIQYLGREVRVRSSAGPAVTRIDATGLGTSTVRFVDHEGPAATLEGFTISGGTGVLVPFNPTLLHGGGLFLNETSPTIVNCVFVLNSSGTGGGFYAAISNATFTDCRFFANTGGAGAGGRVDLSTVQFVRCAFIGNPSMNNAGGLFVAGAAHVVAIDCQFGDNVGGGVVLSTKCTLEARRCVFTANSGDIVGGGLEVSDASAELTDCLIADNSATLGGGLYVIGGSLTLASCTLVRNTGHGLKADAATVTADNCIFWNDQPAEFDFAPSSSVTINSSNVQGGWAGPGANNISADPSFAPHETATWTQGASFDAATSLTTLTDGNASFEPGALVGTVIVPNTAFSLKTAVAANTSTTLTVVGQIWSLIVPSGAEYRLNNDRLALVSPCIDAGSGGPGSSAAADLDGNPRFAGVPDVPDTGLGECPVIDMGAYEHQPRVPQCPPCPDCASPPDGVVDVLDFLVLLSSWGTAGPCDVDGNGTVEVLDMLQLLSAWGPCP